MDSKETESAAVDAAVENLRFKIYMKVTCSKRTN